MRKNKLRNRYEKWSSSISFVFNEGERIDINKKKEKKRPLSGCMPQFSVKVQYIQSTWNLSFLKNIFMYTQQ